MPRRSAALRRGLDVVVATPGRLLDHVGQRTIDLSIGRDPRPRRGRPDARHGLHPRHPPRPRGPPEARRQNLLFCATFSNEIRTLAERLHARSRLGPGHAAQLGRPARDPGRPPGRPRAQARAAEPPRAQPAPSTRRSSSPAPSTAPTGSPSSSAATASRPSPSTATRASRSASAPSPTSRPVGRPSSSRPRSPRAASTSTSCRTSSTTSCRWSPRTTSIASAGPGAPARRATPSRSSASTR